MDFKTKEDTLTSIIEEKLPLIDGVTWNVYIDQCYISPGYTIRVVPSIHVNSSQDLLDKENMTQIFSKLHEILSFGQVKLELE